MAFGHDRCGRTKVRLTIEDRGGWPLAQTAWNEIKLLALARAKLDVFVTVDCNLSSQQYLPRFDIAVIWLSATSNGVSDLVAILSELLQAIPSAPKGAATAVRSGGSSL